MTTDAATLTDQFTCPDCGTEYRSWATYSRTDACRKARQAERFNGSFADEDRDPTLEPSKHYGNVRIESIDHESGPGGAHDTGVGTSVMAIDKQVAFLRRLMVERNLDPATEIPATLTKAVASALIDNLLQVRIAAPTTTTRKANRYASACGKCGTTVAEGAGYVAQINGRWIAEHKDGECVATAPVVVILAYEPSKGDVHVVDGEYFRIHESQGTGRHYAAHFDGHRFEYARGAIAKCTAENLCTAEQAAAFGHLHHQCVFCARQLDTPESTAVGYGARCASKRGLPWG